jgi:hypothetical protein
VSGPARARLRRRLGLACLALGLAGCFASAREHRTASAPAAPAADSVERNAAAGREPAKRHLAGPPATVRGSLTWNTIEGGFWGLLASDGQRYDLHFASDEQRAWCERHARRTVEVFGAPVRGVMTTHMWGTVFRVDSLREAR